MSDKSPSAESPTTAAARDDQHQASLDEALAESFPASDPVSLANPSVAVKSAPEEVPSENRRFGLADAGPIDLTAIETYDPHSHALRVIVDTPGASRAKYRYDPATDCLMPAAVLPEGMVFPFAFGFIPSTSSENGDPLDVLILSDFPILPRALVLVRLIGGIEAQQREEKAGYWIRNDRLIGIALSSRSYSNLDTIEDLRPHLVDEINGFFIQYNRCRSRVFEPLRVIGPAAAMEQVAAGQTEFARRRGA